MKRGISGIRGCAARLLGLDLRLAADFWAVYPEETGLEVLRQPGPLAVLDEWLASCRCWLRRTWLDEAAFVGEHDGLDPVPELQLGQDAGHVGLDGRFAEEERGCDLGVGAALGDQAQDLQFPAGERLQATRPAFCWPECSFRGGDNRKLQFAVLAAAALHGGAEPDLLGEVTWWQTDDFWQYALFAAVAYIRIAADRAGVPVPQACRALAQLPGLPPG